MVVAIALVLGGVAMLLLKRRSQDAVVRGVEAMPARSAVAIGLFQCLAMVPGVSRSGASILGALPIGVERKAAAEFSFFLAVPTILAATSYDLYRNRDLLSMEQLNAILLGGAAAFVTALLVVKALVAVGSRYGFAPFAWYRIGVGVAATAWLMVS